MPHIAGKQGVSPKRRKPPTKSFSLRLTTEEKRLLEGRAGRLPLAAYIRSLILLHEDHSKRRKRIGSPQRDHEALARVLALLGQSRVANNLNQLAKAVNIGALPVTPETEAEIGEACAAVIAMRCDLLRALGLAGG